MAPAASQQVQDGPYSPEETDDRPDHLLDSGQVVATRDVDERQDKGDGVQEDRQQDLDENFHAVTVSEPRPGTR